MSKFFDPEGHAGKITSFALTKVILTWQFLVLITLIFLLPTIKRELRKIANIKGKEFEVNFEQAAIFQNVDDTTVQKLKGLDENAFQFFLIKGGPHGNEIKPHFDYLDNAELDRINKLLATLNLIRFDGIRRDSSTGENLFSEHTTPEGIALHNAIVSAVYKTLAKEDDE